MTCRNPTRFFGLPEQGLRPGHAADLFVYRQAESGAGFEILETIIAGQVRFGTRHSPR